VANNNYPQITSITSEALQAQIRTLLPSQEGFGTDLMAQNVIVPVIDLTSAAEGSSTPQYLQTALAFGSQTNFSASNSTAVVANTAGFWRIIGTSSIRSGTAGVLSNKITMSDGISSKDVWANRSPVDGNYNSFVTQFDFVVFLDSGESVSVVSNDPDALIDGSVRQVADINGTLVNPSGFSPQ
jgi:flagella basal body P-ring formation protein FlgA